MHKLTPSGRYALNLVDTIKVDADKAVLLTEGVKSSKDTLFFLTQDMDEETEKKSTKKPPVKPLKNGSPVKQKTVAGKVLRNQTRRAAQDEVHQTALAKLIEHQKELHDNLQSQGLVRFSEDGVGSSGKEGKGWKKFQSYKGEGALPSEVERLRVSAISAGENSISHFVTDCRRPESPNCRAPHTRVRCSFPYQHYQKCEQKRRRRLHLSQNQLPDPWSTGWKERRYSKSILLQLE